MRKFVDAINSKTIRSVLNCSFSSAREDCHFGGYFTHWEKYLHSVRKEDKWRRQPWLPQFHLWIWVTAHCIHKKANMASIRLIIISEFGASHYWRKCYLLEIGTVFSFVASIDAHRMLASFWKQKSRTSPLGKAASLLSMLSMKYFTLWDGFTSTIVLIGMITLVSTGKIFSQVSQKPTNSVPIYMYIYIQNMSAHKQWENALLYI